MFKFKEYDLKKYRVSLLLTVFFLGSIGMIIMSILGEAEDKLFEKQVAGYIAGVLVAIFISFIDYHFICKLFVLMYAVNFVLLFVTKFTSLGKVHFEAKRWIVIGNLRIQPSEFTKIIMILVLAKLFDILRRQINKWYVLLVIAIVSAIPVGLVFIQPDLSTSIVLVAVFSIMLFMAGLSYKILFPAIGIGIPAIIVFFWYIQQDFQGLLKGYQQKRILALIRPEDFPEKMWQQNNAAKAIRSGGVLGKLMTGEEFSLSTQKLPAIESDFVFAAIAEGFGFIGGCVVIGLLCYFVYRSFQIAKTAKDNLGMLVAGGIGTLVMLQSFVNICVVTSLLPNTGIPLPFVSSGLSSLLGNLSMLGVLLNVGMQCKKKEKKEKFEPL